MKLMSLVLGVAMSLTTAWSAAAGEPLKAGDRIVFLGDSITQAGVAEKGYVTLVRQAIEAAHADLKVEVIGAGISGHRVPNLEERLERDVLAKKPTVVVIYIGINDVWHSQSGRGTPRPEFEAGLKRIIGKITEGGARVVLCTPSVIGEKTDGSNELDVMLEEYSAASRKVAVETKSQLLDLRRKFQSHLEQHNANNAEAGVLTSDRVHLNDAGNAFVAACMLQALGVPTGDAKPLLRHVVLFRFKADVTPAQQQEVADAFGRLPSKIDAIVDFEWGTDVSVEGKSEGFTHGFVVTFRDAAGREQYLPHPAHQEFVKLVGPRIDGVLVYDFFVGK